MSDTADAVSLSSSTPQRQLNSVNNLLQKSELSIKTESRWNRVRFVSSGLL
ncbi:helix-turn-helix domain-containing protein [Halorubrum ezzemoulense]|uniref:helix-turn-helix domain-containing protein n=1 Tax=Halorubrum ezzemoulense TaxID=337243 RepID=UPI003CE44FCE